MSLFTRKRKGNRLSDMEFDEVSLVKREANQHSKVLLHKSDLRDPDLRIDPETATTMLSELAKGGEVPDDDDEDLSEFVREVGDDIEVRFEDGEWVNIADLSDEEFTDVLDQLGIDDQDDTDDDLEDEEDEDDDDYDFEEDEDTHDGIDEEPVPALSKLSKAAAEGSALAKAASDNLVKMVDEQVQNADILDRPIPERYRRSPLAEKQFPLSKSQKDSIRRVQVLRENPQLYSDYRELRENAVGAVAKGRAVQISTAALMATVKDRAASLSKSDEGKGLSPAQLRAKVIQSDPEIAKAYRRIQFEKVRAS